ncbi:rare lipoprotein A [Roseovarius albus]|uniref:Rare lipoprotein A n=2 Tax=Roseovarius albus TaxID=1247867 RepID=A0A1X6ZA90_9RHOB|nr:rare lipoprotein A [Roseovarius albus]
MSIRSIGRLRAWQGVAMFSMIALAGCEEGQGFLKPDNTEGTEASQTVPKTPKGEARDVEAPEVFQVTTKGLWDGRPSLGGIWVAHPDVGQPERVIIRNTSNSKSVVGALFRRERNNPGPAIQVSSDAADELGMLAGAPAELSVTALRKETPPPPVEEPEAAPEPAAEPLEVAAVAEPAKESPKETKEKTPAKKKSEKKTKKPAPIESNSLDTVAGAAAAIDAAEIAKAASESSGTEGVSTQTTNTSSLKNPYIQVAIFSQKENAEKTAADLRKKDLQSSVREQKSQGKSLWRVVVGPASTEVERSAMLKKIKGNGFNDAYPVRN